MNENERESLQRDLSDALAALQRSKSVSTLDALAEHLMKLGPLFRFHGLLLREALHQDDRGAITAQLIQVLAKLERGVG